MSFVVGQGIFVDFGWVEVPVDKRVPLKLLETIDVEVYMAVRMYNG
jgi:hypothetical protein